MQERLGLIYRITNQVNGKSYIGQTTKTIDTRWYEHQWASQNESPQAIHRAMRKYGILAFSIEILAELPEIFLNVLEAFFIIQFSSHITQNGYNMTYGGSAMGSGKQHPCYGKELSEDHRLKIGKAHLGKKRSNETRRKQSIAATGRKHTQATITKMTGRKLSECHVASLKKAWAKRK